MEDELAQIKRIILEKKELRGVQEEFLDQFLEEYFQKHKKILEILREKKYNEKSKEFEEIKKVMRKKLRVLHGVFSKNVLSEEKQRKIIDALRKAKEEKNSEKEEHILRNILKSHRSTFEREGFYSDLYTSVLRNKDFEKIIDLGCGYNPFSYKLLVKATDKRPKYLAVDINEKDSAFIQHYFDLEGIDGVSATLDLTNKDELKTLEKEPRNSICLAFKLLDSLEARKKGSSEQLLGYINSKVIIVSFPLKTISGKDNIKSERRWFLNLIQKNNYKILEKIIGNEKYYILIKTS